MEIMSYLPLILGGLGALSVFVMFKVALNLRRVVSTNEVHIVQTGKATVSYGKNSGNGNSYYEWPSWIPFVGVTKIVLPVSNFDVDLEHYMAYDSGRLPFLVTVKAFFRIKDSNRAAASIASFKELHDQLQAIVQGAIRTVLAGSDIESIMEGRSKFGDEFTKEVNENLENWGVETVRNIELMDIQDAEKSDIIKSITMKKQSQIQMESRTEVAKNLQAAKIAEIESQKQVDLQNQEAQQVVGLRTIETQRQVDLQNQAKAQAVKEAEKITKEKEMAVAQVEQLRKAEINRDVNLVNAEAARKRAVIEAEASKSAKVLNAEAELESQKRQAEAVTLHGTARAESEKALQMAPISAQIALAKEIGSNKEYQEYLLKSAQIAANQAIGEKQAEALKAADIKVISNTGTPSQGITNVMDLFSANGGIQMGAALEGFASSELGQSLLEKVVGTKPATDAGRKPGTDPKVITNLKN